MERRSAERPAIDTPVPAPHDRRMKHEAPSLATIGYEGALLDDFVATLKAASIQLLIDVRELPISRRKGFAKSALSTAMATADIGYLHLKGLGDPKPGREAARAGNHAGFLKVFRAHMLTPAARFDLNVAASHVAAGRACLMCYERDHAGCHRTLVAEAIHAIVPVRIRHIGVRSGLAAVDRATTGFPAAVWA